VHRPRPIYDCTIPCCRFLILLNRLINRMRLLRFFHLPFLFGLPLYYTWQASDVIRQTRNNDSEYCQWRCEQPESTVTELPILHAASAVAELEEIDSESTSPSPSPVLRPPESLLKVRVAWNTFVDSRLDEWRIAVTFAGVLVACVYSDLIYTPRAYSI
jgi:hypothetical protein